MSSDPLTQLKKLGALRDAGVVTEDEFQLKKKQLLDAVGIDVVPAPLPAASMPTFVAPGRIEAKQAANVQLAVAGRITWNDVDYHEREAARHKTAIAELEQHQRAVIARQSKVRPQLTLVALLTKARAFVDLNGTARAGIAAITVTLVAATTIGVAELFAKSALWLTISGVFGFGLGIMSAIVIFWYPSDDEMRTFGARLSAELTTLGHTSEQLTETLRQAKLARDLATSKAAQLRAVLESRVHELLTRDWRMFRGGDFENFLGEVFTELGYLVAMTGKSGDQGVDLIVSRDGVRVAVQAKGYADSVSNSAVQEAHTGMAFHSCSRCVVITNSAFTPAAKELAARVGCALIDGSMIPQLINGGIHI
jgi:restriction system protein